MGGIIWLIVVIYIIKRVMKTQRENEYQNKRGTDKQPMQQRYQQPMQDLVRQNRQKWEQNTQTQEELKKRLQEKYGSRTDTYSKPAQNTYSKPEQNTYSKPEQNTYSKPAQNTYSKPAQNTKNKSVQNIQRAQMTEMGGKPSAPERNYVAEQGEILKRAAANVKENEPEESSTMMQTVEDLIVMGYHPKLTFERDFISEAMDMLSSIDTSGEI